MSIFEGMVPPRDVGERCHDGHGAGRGSGAESGDQPEPPPVVPDVLQLLELRPARGVQPEAHCDACCEGGAEGYVAAGGEDGEPHCR